MLERLRRRLHRRWMARQPHPMLCLFREPVTWPWIDRYNEWLLHRYGDVARWGVHVGPLWLLPLTMFAMKLHDWRSALVLRRPWGGTAEWNRINERIDQLPPDPDDDR